MVEAPLGPRVVAGEGEVIALIGKRHPHPGLNTVVLDDLLGEPAAEILLEEDAVRANVRCQAIQVVETPHTDAARREALSLVLQGRLQLRWSHIPFSLVIELDHVSVGITA